MNTFKCSCFVIMLFFMACGESSSKQGLSLYKKGLDHLNTYYVTNDTVELLYAKKN